MDLGQEFTALCLQTMRKEDYGDKAKRKVHNKAMDGLQKLQKKLLQTDARAVLMPLLSHEDSRVRVNAAAACRALDVLMEPAVETLRDVIVNEPDTTLKMSAAMLLKQCMED